VEKKHNFAFNFIDNPGVQFTGIFFAPLY